MQIKYILHKSPFKRSCRHRIHSLLRPDDAKGSADIILTYLMHFASVRVRHSYWGQKGGHA